MTFGNGLRSNGGDCLQKLVCKPTLAIGEYNYFLSKSGLFEEERVKGCYETIIFLEFRLANNLFLI